MKTRITLTLLTALTLAGCSAPPPPPPALDNNALISSEVNGVKLQHRAAITAPKQFKPIGKEYRSLYAASIMSSPGYDGTPVGSLDNASTFYALGEVENHWLAISAIDGGDLVGYIQTNAGVPKTRYKSTLRKDLPHRARAAKQDCVKVGGDGKACKDANSATWILQ
ncbi:type VI secretion system accessory protein TagV [Serratia quinivorans]|uniref:type VI secretion system accessory protein TagV n=1 Tax=Serratia quinivorans TaxID=137545 RepID=UPI003F999F75